MKEHPKIQVGNAEIGAKNGWFVGHFIDKELGLRHSDDVELKWGVMPTGWEREWAPSDARTTISILISGIFEIEFRDQTIMMSKPGDFVMWGEGHEHKARTLGDTDAVILTVRWPSIQPR